MQQELNILDVLNRLNMKPVKTPKGRHWIYRCPFCGDSRKRDNHGHLYVEVNKNVWQCHRCGESGNALTLYARLTGQDTKSAYRELVGGMESRIKERPTPNTPPRPQPVRPYGSEPEMVSLEQRDAVYNALLDLLELEVRHYRDLVRRGFPAEIIKKEKFRSVPADYSLRAQVCRELLSRGYDLVNVPGFYKDRNGSWNFVASPGYFIPVRTALGMIAGMQIRADEGSPKYFWFSGHDVAFEGQIEVAGPQYDGPVWITEGPVKAKIAAYYLKRTTIGIPGVSAWRKAMPVLNDYRDRDKILAFDADAAINPHVAKNLQAFTEALYTERHRLKLARWSINQGKGLDDVILYLARQAHGQIEKQLVPMSLWDKVVGWLKKLFRKRG
ncbi:DNA primase [Thermincola ferriacetica]|uniref:DNA primase n=1 Tax=Thermincola ferriacetica TaxID=281456 RepID=A0A0L6VZB3_9FIRM|nr:DUF3854 domain-containing protein [Thermincola ferriacetica]KNZ68667.1 DNA primase [Thermincola ferriacetica]